MIKKFRKQILSSISASDVERGTFFPLWNQKKDAGRGDSRMSLDYQVLFCKKSDKEDTSCSGCANKRGK